MHFLKDEDYRPGVNSSCDHRDKDDSSICDSGEWMIQQWHMAGMGKEGMCRRRPYDYYCNVLLLASCKR